MLCYGGLACSRIIVPAARQPISEPRFERKRVKQMDDQELWQVIAEVARSGDETSVFELKSYMYDFSGDAHKSEFVKDVCAIANSLTDRHAEGYLVIGVCDSTDCPDRSDPAQYVTGVTIPNRDELERRVNQILESHVDPPLTLDCRLLTSALTGMGKEIAVFVIRAWTESHEADPHPYVVRQSVGRLQPGIAFIKRGTMVLPALRADIVNLAARHIRLKHEHETKALEAEHLNTIESLRVEGERMLRSLEEDFRKSIDGLQDDRKELRKRIDLLEDEVTRLSAEERAWRHIAYLGLFELYSRVSSDVREGKLKRILAHGKKERSYSEIIREIAQPD